MNLFPWKKQTEFFSEEEKALLIEAIRRAEQRTSGEVRLFVESHCRYMDASDRAQEIFLQLGMERTAERNATLLYLALKDHQAAVYGDAGIHAKVGTAYWQQVVARMLEEFRHDHLVSGICGGIDALGEALHQYFPYDHASDKNELPDDIVFGS
ncbi:TPM domain-containing protein [Flaviaesturariibacter amylovorans]|uniref:TPM domain-containing protein n=1 Tax=Flaviaesturariibacter amylovorans TaxID=1084520 RepID=A0ABP8HTI1_9BACT